MTDAEELEPTADKVIALIAENNKLRAELAAIKERREWGVYYSNYSAIEYYGTEEAATVVVNECPENRSLVSRYQYGPWEEVKGERG